jgi:acetyl/propionyl-CoA carboxylase alpha subunit
VDVLVGEHPIFFQEMNPLLPAEDPVPQALHGIPPAALQIAIAEGAPLPLSQQQVRCEGHAIEARIYAEDPLRDYLPQSGELIRFELPADHGVRVDAGYRTGDRVTAHYDPLLAKIIAHGADRELARRRLGQALQRAWSPGVATNLPLLRELVQHPSFAAAELDTGFLARHGLPTAPPLNLEQGALVATAYAWAVRQRRAPQGAAALPGWRIEGSAGASDRWRSQAAEVEASWRIDGEALALEIAGEGGTKTHRVRVLHRRGDELVLEVDGLRRCYRLAHTGQGEALEDGDVAYLHLGDGEAVVALVPRFPSPLIAAEEGSCLAPTPGAVAAVHVEAGQPVEGGQLLVTLEAMKMEHPVRAPDAGVVAEVAVEAGQQVEQGALLVRLQPAS